MKSTSTGVRSARTAIGASLVAVCLLVGSACASSSSGGNAGGTSTSLGVAPAALLGPVARATGTPVKVGLITDGANCSGCKDEAHAAHASVDWANEHMNGLAGHPMKLVVCTDALDPGKATDCANQMISDNVVAVVIGSSGVIETSWRVLHGAHIPVINVSATNSSLLHDPDSTFLLNDPNAGVVALPIGVAQKEHAKTVSVIIVDLPIATDIYKSAVSTFTHEGLRLDLVPVPLVTPDMTPQAQEIATKNPHGLVFIVGNDQFCIPALKGLQAVGFGGSISMISQCLTDATRKAMGAGLKGVQISSVAPIGDNSDASLRQYQAVLDHYAGGKNINPQALEGISMFQTFGGLAAGTRNLTGAVTPASVIAAMKNMKNQVLPGSGNRWFRCNGKAVPATPSVCSASVLAGTLDAAGIPVRYSVNGNHPIKD